MSRLSLLRESSGWRHFVEGKPVHCGSCLQWSPDRGITWINVRYEAGGGSGEKIWPVLYAPDGSRISPAVESLFQWPPQ